MKSKFNILNLKVLVYELFRPVVPWLKKLTSDDLRQPGSNKIKS